VRPRAPASSATGGETEPSDKRKTRTVGRDVPTRTVSPVTLKLGLCVAVVCCCIAMSLPLAHIVSYATDRGHDISHAVEILSVLLIAAFVSRSVLVGTLSEALGGLHALIAFSGLQAVALAALGFTEGLIALYVLAALFGLGFGGVFPVYTVIVREHLPSIEAGRWTGIVFMFGATGMGIGSWIGGVMFDKTGTYLWAFLVGVGFNVVNLLIILAIKPRKAPPRIGKTAEAGAG
jgi:MFS family permease